MPDIRAEARQSGMPARQAPMARGRSAVCVLERPGTSPAAGLIVSLPTPAKKSLGGGVFPENHRVSSHLFRRGPPRPFFLAPGRWSKLTPARSPHTSERPLGTAEWGPEINQANWKIARNEMSAIVAESEFSVSEWAVQGRVSSHESITKLYPKRTALDLEDRPKAAGDDEALCANDVHSFH